MTMRKTKASAKPIWRARCACFGVAARHQDRDEDDVVDAEHDLEHRQGDQRGPGVRIGQQFESWRRYVLRAGAPATARPAGNRRAMTHKRRRDPEPRAQILQHSASAPAPPRPQQRNGHGAQPPRPGTDARSATARRSATASTSDRDRRDPRRRAAAATDRTRSRSTAPESRGNNCPRSSCCGRRNRARRSPRWRCRPASASESGNSAAGRDRIGRHEHIGREIDHQIERVAGPARQHARRP